MRHTWTAGRTGLVRILLALAAAVSLTGGSLAYDGFTDVSRDDWFYWTVDWVIGQGIMGGTSETTFSPNDAGTRSTAISMLYNAEGRPYVETAWFDDVSPDAEYAAAVSWGAATGVAGGYGDGRFGPDDRLTRQQFVTMLYRLIKIKGEGYAEGNFTYAPPAPDWGRVTEYAREGISWMVMHGFMEGDGTPIDPQGTVTRAQAAEMLTRFYQFVQDETVTTMEGVYLGVEGYGQEGVDEYSKMNFRFRFFAGGEEIRSCMDNGTLDETGEWSYDLQNRLKEGLPYRLTFRRGKIVDVEPLETVTGTVEALTESSITVAGRTLPLSPYAGSWRVRTAAGGATVSWEQAKVGDSVRVSLREGGIAGNVFLTPLSAWYTPPVEGTPGVRTIKNFLATGMMPIGVTLYQYGGGWNWQISTGNAQTTTIGLPQEWVAFYRSQNASYTYKDPGGSSSRRNKTRSYYPFGMYSEYNYLGADCAGYVGWTLYNTLNTESGGTSFLGSAMAKKLSERGWGSWTQYASDASVLRPGDVVGISGHIYISLGRCSDGSTVVAHSTPTNSRTGNPGGGIQLSAVGSSKSCQAYKLADRYMSRYWPTWYSRYAVELKSPRGFYAFGGESWGRFRWDVSGGGVLTDPDGYQNMSADAVLADLFAGA